MEVNNILVPMDFSKCSKNALKVAIQLADKWKSQLRIMHSTFLPSATVGVGDAMVQPVADTYENYDDPFEELESEFPDLKNITYSTKQYHSVVTDAIYTEIEGKEMDLVVMGTKGTHDILEKLIGGITTTVIDFAKVPVLVIPENVSSFDALKIGISADFHMIEPSSFNLVKKLADTFGSEVQIFNIGHEDERMDFKHSKSKTLLETYFAGHKLSYHQVVDEKATHGIFEYIDSHGIDLLVMFPRHHKFLERLFKASETKKVAMKINIPMLAVHQ
ncbi:MAG: universal stress protein [Cyclobacteriaceae bacterium]